ncbi:hypothetical protein [Blastomonas sp. AAP53]|uniref:hypothetical protein n=1 Tax=Blastomonas sp. AAP53 TaxID=1248760 RepID=UPI00126763DD|nr:hypothetical protein [Blastomonas sp. AAP53]
MLRDAGALLRHADAQARQALAVPALVRQRLSPDSAQTLREDDLSLAGGFVDSIARRLAEALGAADAAAIARHAVLACPPATRLLYARAIEARLCHQSGLIGLPTAELPPRVEALVGDAQDELAESAMALIIAQSRFVSRAQGFAIDIDELPPEILHALVRLAVAWLQDNDASDPMALRNAADVLLAQFDERRGRPHRLMRFCHLFELPRAGDDWALADNGPSLAIAMLERSSGVAGDLLLDMLRDPDLTRLAVVLRACAIEVNVAARLLQDFAVLASLRVDDLPSAAALRAIASDDAMRIVAGWRNMDPVQTAGPAW